MSNKWKWILLVVYCGVMFLFGYYVIGPLFSPMAKKPVSAADDQIKYMLRDNRIRYDAPEELAEMPNAIGRDWRPMYSYPVRDRAIVKEIVKDRIY